MPSPKSITGKSIDPGTWAGFQIVVSVKFRARVVLIFTKLIVAVLPELGTHRTATKNPSDFKQLKGLQFIDRSPGKSKSQLTTYSADRAYFEFLLAGIAGAATDGDGVTLSGTAAKQYMPHSQVLPAFG